MTRQSMLTEPVLPVLTLSFVEGMYRQYGVDPASVPSDWRAFFDGMRMAQPDQNEGTIRAAAGAGPHEDSLQQKTARLVDAYRRYGHTVAALDPLGTVPEPTTDLEPATYGLTPVDGTRAVPDPLRGDGSTLTVAALTDRLRQIYCGTVAVEFMHIGDPAIRRWIAQRMETVDADTELPRQAQNRVLALLVRAGLFEEFLRKKYIGAKSFSLEGCESLIPLLDAVVEEAAAEGVEELVVGMAHRGRLNVLVNLLGKRPRDVFREFEDADGEQDAGHGDVRYHMGFSTDRRTASGKVIHLSLSFNPSHLEFIDPVVLGRVRAKQDRGGDVQRRRVLGLLLHGEAAFAGEGIVQETLNLSGLPAYHVGGVLHIIVNNQIGFTTSPEQGRSSRYATDVAKLLETAIFHVNGEDPEAVVRVGLLALDFCRTFQRDTIIDLFGYRRHGHNEADEPSFTHPLMYRAIRERLPVREGYLQRLETQDADSDARRYAEETAAKCREEWDEELAAARSPDSVPPPTTGRGIWQGYHGGANAKTQEVETSVAKEQLLTLAGKLTELPAKFQLHPLLERSMARRRAIAEQRRPLDWSTAEALAFATLAVEAVPVRLTGQDSQRGTFGQRHAVLHDAQSGAPYEPLAHLREGQAPVTIENSPLSEAAVLGFEFGYSLDFPDGLTIWEAQFGDFANAAQVYIDQFIAAAEAKWRRLSGLVLLLPHGWEGQGPEHTSARLERFLALAADDNFQVVYPTTPAQYFHLLRRQALRPWRKPLIVMTPKQILRNARAVSDMAELSQGGFHSLIVDSVRDPRTVERIVLCSGRIYYDLRAHQEKTGREDTAVIRIEQLYPFPDDALRTALHTYPTGTPAVWVQEEPENMGAWSFVRLRFAETSYESFPLEGVFRVATPTPAGGSHARHALEQANVVARAFADPPEVPAPKAHHAPAPAA